MASGDDQTLEGEDTHSPNASMEATVVPGGRSPAPVPVPELSEGERVDRYLVLRKLGTGGMGSVYAAYDPELDRKVALKLVHPARAGEASRARLLREAQAMARVTHPNVVTVHDVGTHGDRVYVAMEFIEGQTLKEWSAARGRSWEEVVEVFSAAGRGLAAAHGEGLVHRDFKPENAMITEGTGRVVVLDFGLARGRDVAPSEVDAASEGSGASTAALLSTEITQAGRLSGTPAYMSPEQFGSGDIDALGDQFSFCVSLYEALYGQRPFAGDTPAALLFSATAGKVREPPGDREVPQWLRRIVVRGLAAESSARWPSMDALLGALERERPRRRRRALGALAAVVLAASLGAAGYVGSRTSLCSGADAQLDGVWDDVRREAVDARVRSLDLPWFEHSWEGSVAVLDAYADSWAASHEDACEATTRRGEQSEHVMDLRMACLARARLDLEATADRLSTLDAEGARRVHELVGGLPPLARCSDVAALSAEVDPPADPSTAAAVDGVRRELATARTGVLMGDRGIADELEGMRERVMQIDYAPLGAEYLALLGSALRVEARSEPARENLERALHVALSQRQWDLAVRVLSELTRVTGGDLQSPKEGMIFAELADGLASQPGIDDASARLARGALAAAYDYVGNYDRSLEIYRELLPRIPDDQALERARALSGMAIVLETNGSLPEAEQVHRQVLALHEQILGSSHPEAADSYSNLGNAMLAQDRYAEAEKLQRRALEIDLAVFGAGHPAIAASRSNLGAALAAAGKHAEAEAEMLEVLAIIGESHPRAGLVLGNLGALALEQGKDAEAEARYRAALAHYADKIGTDHPRLLILYSGLGVALDGQGRHEEAEAAHRTALRIALAAHDEDHDLVSKVRHRLGENLVDQGRADEAIELLEAALGQRVAASAIPGNLGATRFALARALWDTGTDRARAIELARQALADFERAKSSNVKRVRRWLAQR